MKKWLDEGIHTDDGQPETWKHPTLDDGSGLGVALIDEQAGHFDINNGIARGALVLVLVLDLSDAISYTMRSIDVAVRAAPVTNRAGR